jgi:integrase
MMPRVPKPFKRPDRTGYWTKAGKKWTRLGDTKAGAQAELHRLLAARGQPAPSPGRITVAELIDLWLEEWKSRVKPRTWGRYQEYAQSLTDHCGRALARELKPLHLTAWLKAHPGWASENTRGLALSVAKMAFRWATLEGWIDRDPIGLVRVPKGDPRPPAPPGAAEKLPDGIRSEAFRLIFEFLIQTGCRPGEARTLTASRIALDAGLCTVDGKTGLRDVPLTDAVVGLLRPLCAANPTGPVFRNTRGAEWTEKALQCQFARCSKRGGGGRMQPYHSRGIFASRAVAGGADSAMVAKYLGHADTERVGMLVQFYLNPEEQDLRKAAERAARPSSAAPPPPSDGTPARKPPDRRGRS